MEYRTITVDKQKMKQRRNSLCERLGIVIKLYRFVVKSMFAKKNILSTNNEILMFVLANYCFTMILNALIPLIPLEFILEFRNLNQVVLRLFHRVGIPRAKRYVSVA